MRPGPVRSRGMVFRNLPIEYDEDGRPVLRAPRERAYATDGATDEAATDAAALSPEQIADLAARSRFVKVFTVESVADSVALTPGVPGDPAPILADAVADDAVADDAVDG